MSLAAVHGVAMQCFNYEIRIPAKQGFASSNIISVRGGGAGGAAAPPVGKKIVLFGQN